MLAIKLKRIGKKHQASFRIIVTEKRSKLQGRYIEDLGWWNPHVDKFEIKKERAGYWVKTGAQSTDSVYNLLVSAGVIAGPKKPVHKKSKNKEESVPPAVENIAEIAVETTTATEKPADLTSEN